MLTGALGVLWALKARVEERLLAARYPGYADYARRVRFRLVAGALLMRVARSAEMGVRPWPEQVERVAAFLRAAGAEARLEELG